MTTFLSLPYDIRLEIYLYLLGAEKGIDPLMRIIRYVAPG